MVIIELNAVPYAATGRIAKQITEFANENGHKAIFAYSWTKNVKYKSGKNEMVVTSFLSRLFHGLFSCVFGGDGFYSLLSTWHFVKKLKTIKPDIIHLHIMHSYFLNIPMLFKYIEKNDIKVVWTFHDCWALSGQCSHFVSVGCMQWIDGCQKCPLQSKYSLLPIYNAHYSWNKIYECVKNVSSMTIVPCSDWMAEYVKQSKIFKRFPIKVIKGGIDLSVFRPIDSDFRKKYKCEEKILVLGVAFAWLPRKGLDVFIYLAGRLPENYVLVMVGTDGDVDRQLPERIISIHRTKDQKELAEIYSAADVFINPTRVDTYPTVNMEALACGTPVITFKTGGSPEIIDETCGSVVECDDLDGMFNEIIRVGNNKPYSTEACMGRAKSFDLNQKYVEYLRLFESLK